jgi:sarcosine oxidase subunit delta
MSFLLACPNCGKRQVSEFAFGNEYSQRPSQEEGFEAWTDYVFMKNNIRGKQVEWWYHRDGCKRWFLALRDTTCSTDHVSFWFDDREKYLNKVSSSD